MNEYFYTNNDGEDIPCKIESELENGQVVIELNTGDRLVVDREEITEAEKEKSITYIW